MIILRTGIPALSAKIRSWREVGVAISADATSAAGLEERNLWLKVRCWFADIRSAIFRISFGDTGGIHLVPVDEDRAIEDIRLLLAHSLPMRFDSGRKKVILFFGGIGVEW